MVAARNACVIGWPAAHSRSPLIHNYWIKQHGLGGEYRRESVAPETFADFVRALAERGYVGANVTIPHKEAALALSEPDARAQAIGAANTLWLDNGKLKSTNTDVEGFLANPKTTRMGQVATSQEPTGILDATGRMVTRETPNLDADCRM